MASKKYVSEETKRKLLALKQEELTVPMVTKLFTRTADRNGKLNEPMFNVRDRMKLKANEYINTTDVDTNVGKFLFNKLFIEGMIDSIIPNGYFNDTVTAKSFNKITQYIASAAMDGKLKLDYSTNDPIAKFLKTFEFYGLKLVAAFSPSFTEAVLKPNKELAEKKDKLLKANKDKLQTDLKTMTDIENELVSDAAKLIGDDPGMTLYDSGSRGTFDNDFKNNNIIVGPTMNPQTGEYEFMESNYMDGLQKKDIPKAGNNVVAASYPKAVGTAVGGYLTKQFYSVFQSIQVDAKGTDCGSVGTLEIYLTDKNISDYLYQNVLIDGKNPARYEPLTMENANKYLNKVVRLRSPMYCTSDKLCNACAGEKPYRMQIENIGLTVGVVSNTLMNKRMKQFHNAKVKLHKIDLDSLIV